MKIFNLYRHLMTARLAAHLGGLTFMDLHNGACWEIDMSAVDIDGIRNWERLI